MSATTRAPVGPWVRTHRTALTIAVLAMPLAVTLALLVVRLGSGPTATSTHRPSSRAQQSIGQDPPRPSYVPPLQRINEGCSIAHFGVPC